MTSIDTVRTLCQDSPVRGSITQTVDGVAVTLQLDHYPVLEGSVIITGSGVVPAFTVDESIGLVTFGPVPESQELTAIYKAVLLTNAQIQGILDINAGYSDPVRLSAADCLDAIANSQVLIQKKIKMLDLQTDGPAMAASLRAHAKELRQLVFSQDYNEPAFDIGEEVYDGAGWKEKVVKDWMRQLP